MILAVELIRPSFIMMSCQLRVNVGAPWASNADSSMQSAAFDLRELALDRALVAPSPPTAKLHSEDRSRRIPQADKTNHPVGHSCIAGTKHGMKFKGSGYARTAEIPGSGPGVG
jgi:hypothetical protein